MNKNGVSCEGGADPASPIYGYAQSKVQTVLIYLILFVLAVFVVLAGVVIEVGRNEPAGAIDVAIAVVFAALTLGVVYVTHSGRNLVLFMGAALPTFKILDQKNLIDYGILSVEPYRTSASLLSVLSFLLLSIHCLKSIRNCFGVVVAVGGKGVYIKHVYNRWIHWSYIQKVEEFEQYGEPAFRICLKTRSRLDLKFFWSMSERHPAIWTRIVSIRPMLLREALFSRGKNLAGP